MSNDKDYWKSRQAEYMWQYTEQAEDTADRIQRAYKQSCKYIQGESAKIFSKLAERRGLSEKEARQLLKKLDRLDIESLRKELQKGIPTAEKDEILEMLDSFAYKKRLERLDSLQNEVDDLMQNQYEVENRLNTENYTNVMKDSYYHNIYGMQKQTGLGFEFALLSKDRIDKVLKSKWSGENYSERIWGNNKQLAKELQEELAISLLTGRSNRKTAKAIAERFGVADYKARRLVRTENTFVACQGQIESYKASGVEKYIFLATLDMRTSKKCQKLDMKKFDVNKAQAGVNLPPMHPNCRSTTLADLGEEVNEQMERSARGKDGKLYNVPADMSYEEWIAEQEKKFGKEIIDNEYKKVKNKTRDFEEYKKYKEILGTKNAPKSLAEFQEMKYNKKEEWEIKKREYNTIEKITKKKTYSEQYRNKMISTYYEFKAENYEFTDHSLNRFLGQKTGKDKVNFDKEKLLDILNRDINYIEGDRTIKFYDGISVIQNKYTKEVVSIVTRRNPKGGWEEYGK